MRLRRLTLRNFRSYRDCELRFGTGPGEVNHAVIIGKNGVGKTTILDAVLWCLFGETRRSDVTSIVRLGAADTRVEVEFESGPERYLVRRKRAVHGKATRGELDLYRREGEKWAALSGKLQADTQRSIIEKLGVDLDTLLSSSVIQQREEGRLAEATPGQRRKVIGRALGLDLWEAWATAARKRGTAYDAETKAAELLAAGVAASIKARAPGDGDALEEMTRAESTAEAAASAAEDSASEAEEGKAAVREERDRTRGALERAEARARERSALEDERTEAARVRGMARYDLRECRTAIDGASAVDAAVAGLPAARDAHAAAVGRFAEGEALGRRIEASDARKRNSRGLANAALERGQRDDVRDGSLEAAERAAVELPAFESDERIAHKRFVETQEALYAAQAERPEPQPTSQEREDAELAMTDARRVLANAEAEAGRMAERVAELERRASLLHEVPCTDNTGWLTVSDIAGARCDERVQDCACDLAAECPLLADALSAEAAIGEARVADSRVRMEVEDANERFLASRQSRDAALAAWQAEVDARNARNNARYERRAEEAQALREDSQTYDRARREAQHTRDLAALAGPLREAQRRHDAAIGEADRHRADATDALKERAAAENALANLCKDLLIPEWADAPGLDELREDEEIRAERVSTLTAIATRAPAIAEARGALLGLEARLAATEATVRGLDEQIAAARVPQELVEAARTMAANLDAAERAAATAHAAHGRAIQALADARAQRAQVEELAEELAGHLAAASEARGEAVAWSATKEACELAPQLLIEQAIPAIEHGANRVLEQINANGLRVRLDTQRDLKSGEQAETLDLIVIDGDGELPYVERGGGIQVCVAVALRLALGQVVMQRSGASVEMLIIDEGGFGALDPDGREALKSIVSGLVGMFPLVLVVTHLPDVTEALPQVLDVTRGPDGSAQIELR